MFDAPPVDDAALGAIRGTFAPSYFTLTVAQHSTIQDNVARNDFRFFGTVGSVVMDNWWATDGADLIAASAGRGQP